MKKLLLLAFVIILITGNISGQKLYTWCPKDQIPAPRIGMFENDTVDIVIFDGRIFTAKSRIECTSENTIMQLADFLKKTYPSTTINLLSPLFYYKDPSKNRITIKIELVAYQAAFGADIKVGIGNVGSNFSTIIIPEGKWNAVTAYSIKFYSYKESKEIFRTKDIYKIASKTNTGGYTTAKNILNTSYIDANQELLSFIDKTFFEIREKNTTAITQ